MDVSLPRLSVTWMEGTAYQRQNSDLRNRERSSTIHPQEMDTVGRQASSTAFTGGISEKQMGPKKITNTTTIITNRMIFSRLVLGGVRKIFFRSIST